jgi:hypothetical protein
VATLQNNTVAGIKKTINPGSYKVYHKPDNPSFGRYNNHYS